jgi:hypothetical protein
MKFFNLRMPSGKSLASYATKLIKESFTHIFRVSRGGMNLNRLNLWSFFQALKILAILIKLGLAPTT